MQERPAFWQLHDSAEHVPLSNALHWQLTISIRPGGAIGEVVYFGIGVLSDISQPYSSMSSTGGRDLSADFQTRH